MIKNITVIGGHSLLGQDLIRVLKTKNIKLTATYYKKKYTKKNLSNIFWRKLDIYKNSNLNFLKKNSAVIHLATNKNKIIKDNSFNREKLFLKNLVSVCKKKNILLVFISTSLIYKVQKLSSSEKSALITKHKNLYIDSKLKFDRIISRTSSLKYYILRVPSIYGNNIKQINFIKKFYRKLKKNHEIEFDKKNKNMIGFIHSIDLSKIIYHLIKTNLNFGIYNIQEKKMVRPNKLLEILRKLCNSSSKIKHIYKNQIIDFPKLDCNKIKNKFNLKIENSFLDILRKKI